MMEIRLLNCRIPLTPHDMTEVPTSDADIVAFVQPAKGGSLQAAIWNGTEWRNQRMRRFNYELSRWYSIGKAYDVRA